MSASVTNASALSQYEKVRAFNIAAGQPAPPSPQTMNLSEVLFLSKMILDEVMELLATVATPEDAKRELHQMITDSKDIPATCYPPTVDGHIAKIADQSDALVDIEYYMHNTACKKGVNLSYIFDIVHDANMAKRDPGTGEMLKRPDGKIMKPVGWEGPDVKKEIWRQCENGNA